MPQYFSPGVYVEEVDAGPRPIQGVSTSVTGAVGVTQRGPVDGKPHLVTSFAEFTRIFGGYLAEGDDLGIGQWWRFPNAVQGFFENGGQQLFVKRVTAGSSAATSTLALKNGLFANVLSDVTVAAAVASCEVSVDHAVGILTTNGTTSVTVKNGDNHKDIIASVPVIAIDTTTREIKLKIGPIPNAIDIRASRGDYVVVRAVDTTTPSSAYSFSASSPGKWGDSLVVRMRPMSTPFTVLKDAAADNLLYLTGISKLYAGAFLELSKTGVEKTLVQVQEVKSDHVLLTADLQAGDTSTGAPAFLIEASVEVELLTLGSRISESFQNLRLFNVANNAPPSKDPKLLHNAINTKSKLIEFSSIPNYPTDLTAFVSGSATGGKFGFEPLSGGGDNFGSLTVDDFIGVDKGSGLRTGIKSMEDIDDVSIVIVPGVHARPVVAEMLRHCDLMRYRMAIVDSKPDHGIQDVRAFRNDFDSSRGALYYPWVKARQPGITDDITVPPSGHIAGLYADVDTRRGYHKAPANEILRGITQIARDVTKQEQDLLNPDGVNALRFFPGRGNRVWGARTISSDTNFKYVNVRRIFNFIERSIDEGTQFVVFEPNNQELWSRVRQTISNFLNTQWRAGALEGKTPDEAFFVACDRGTTMTQDDIENGRLICEVGIAPVYPAEFVIFRIQKYTADSKLA